MAMDPQIKALAAMKREVRKIVGTATNDTDKLMLIEFGERELLTLRNEVYRNLKVGCDQSKVGYDQSSNAQLVGMVEKA